MAFPVGDPILYVTPSNRLMNLSSELLVFSSGFYKTQVYGFYSITAPTNAIDKSIIIIFESRVVLTLKWIFIHGGKEEEKTKDIDAAFTSSPK